MLIVPRDCDKSGGAAIAGNALVLPTVTWAACCPCATRSFLVVQILRYRMVYR